jgi:hypothetical protein
MKVRIAVSGLGRLGGELILRVQESRSAELVALVSNRAAELRADPPVKGVDVLDLEQALASDRIDVLLDAHQGGPEEIAELLRRCALQGKGAVTSSAIFDPVLELGPEAASELDATARRTGARLLATGLNPGFLLDMLPAIWGALSPGWTRVSAIRTVEAGAWGPGPRAYLGIGGEPKALEATVPMPLTASLGVMAAALDVVPEGLRETRTALVGAEEVRLGDETFPAGVAIGFDHRASATADGERALELVWHAAVGLDRLDPDAVNGITVQVDGKLPMRLFATGSFAEDPYPATAARMVQSATAMQTVRAGLLRPDEIPFGWGVQL